MQHDDSNMTLLWRMLTYHGAAAVGKWREGDDTPFAVRQEGYCALSLNQIQVLAQGSRLGVSWLLCSSSSRSRLLPSTTTAGRCLVCFKQSNECLGCHLLAVAQRDQRYLLGRACAVAKGRGYGIEVVGSNSRQPTSIADSVMQGGLDKEGRK